MQVNNVNSPNFNGYKNVIANKVRRTVNGEMITFMSMQLDNFGAKDLDKWKYLQKDLLKRDFNNDVMTFELIESKLSTLLGVCDNMINLNSLKHGDKKEGLYLKALSLIASLTKRIQNDPILIKDENYRQIASDTKFDLINLLMGKKQSSIDEVVWGSYYTDVTPQERASDINKTIDKKMLAYFAD